MVYSGAGQKNSVQLDRRENHAGIYMAPAAGLYPVCSLLWREKLERKILSDVAIATLLSGCGVMYRGDIDSTDNIFTGISNI